MDPRRTVAVEGIAGSTSYRIIPLTRSADEVVGVERFLIVTTTRSLGKRTPGDQQKNKTERLGS